MEVVLLQTFIDFIDFYNGSGVTILKTYKPTTSAYYGPVL